jgi:hypothetical protein
METFFNLRLIGHIVPFSSSSPCMKLCNLMNSLTATA